MNARVNLYYVKSRTLKGVVNPSDKSRIVLHNVNICSILNTALTRRTREAEGRPGRKLFDPTYGPTKTWRWLVKLKKKIGDVAFRIYECVQLNVNCVLDRL